MELAEYGPMFAVDIAFWRQGFIDPACPVEQLGKLSVELSEKFRAIAIMALLVGADSDLFHHHLIRSGLIRKSYLERLQKKGITGDHHQCSGRYEPFLDAVAADDFDLAKAIANLSPVEMQKGHEYEDDFCYARILHGIASEAGNGEIRPLLEQFEAYLKGEASARFDAAKALANRDQQAFEEAFEALLAEQEERIRANIKRGQLEEPGVIANRLVFVEGLALLRLAEKQGLTTELEYRYCPSLARVPMTRPFPGE